MKGKSSRRAGSRGEPDTRNTARGRVRRARAKAASGKGASADAQSRAIVRLQRQLARLESRLREAEQRGQTMPERIEALERELGRRRLTQAREQEVARDFQQRLLPAFLPRVEGVSFAVHLRPAPRMGGDIYDIYEPGPGSIGFFVADPSGHGLRAALLVTLAKSAFDIFRVNEYSPRAILERLNLNLLTKTPENEFLTAFLAILDCATLRLRYVNASYPEPILYGRDRMEMLCGHGLFVGLFEDPEYEEQEVQLRPDDRLLIYSDGFCNALDSCGRTYSVERLQRLVRENADLRPGPLLLKLFADLEEHQKGQPAADDALALAALFSAVLPREETIEIPSEPASLPRVVVPIMKRLAAAGYGERAEFGVRLALEEALINAMKHGNKMDRSKKIRVAYVLDDKKITIRIADEGKGFDPAAVPDPTREENLEVAHGRGLALMRAYVDSLTFNEKGNEVCLVKRAPWA